MPIVLATWFDDKSPEVKSGSSQTNKGLPKSKGIDK